MTEIIIEETVVLRVGCLSGPNLAMELAQGLPAATVVASRFEEVVRQGQMALRSHRFRVYSSDDLRGVELAGVLKNIMAIGAGIVAGLGWGENGRAMLITRGLREMVHLGRVMGAEINAFFGIAGIGDLVATCSSDKSRNYSVGFRMAQGQPLSQVLSEMNEVVEGLNTIRLAHAIADFYGLELPILDALYDVLYNETPISERLNKLMAHPFEADVDFLH